MSLINISTRQRPSNRQFSAFLTYFGRPFLRPVHPTAPFLTQNKHMYIKTKAVWYCSSLKLLTDYLGRRLVWELWLYCCSIITWFSSSGFFLICCEVMKVLVFFFCSNLPAASTQICSVKFPEPTHSADKSLRFNLFYRTLTVYPCCISCYGEKKARNMKQVYAKLKTS